MEIRFYTPELDLIGIMENQTSLLWTRKFYEPGSFQLIAPITDYNIMLCKRGNIIHIDGANEAAVIEGITIRQEHSRRIITAVGRMISSYMARRIITSYSFNGKIETSMRELLTNATKDTGREIPYLQLGSYHGFPESVEYMATYKNLLKYMTMLSKEGNIGFRFTPDFENKRLVFDTFKGEDHSENQSARTRVVFSEEYCNISTLKYQEDDRNYRNVFYIVDPDGILVVEGNATGLERREYGYKGISRRVDYTAAGDKPIRAEAEEKPTRKTIRSAIYGSERTMTEYPKTYKEVIITTDTPDYDAWYRAYSMQDRDEWFRRTGSREFQYKYGAETNYSPWFYYTDRENPVIDYNNPIQIPYTPVIGYHYDQETDESLNMRIQDWEAREAAKDAKYEAELSAWEARKAEILAAHRQALREESTGLKERNKMIINFEPVVVPFGNFEYKRDFDLGDIVTAKKESWGIQEDMRITEIQEIYEHGLMMLSPTLGDLLPETIDWDDR